jgi:hypothetical protein
MISNLIYLCPNKSTRRALNSSITSLWISYKISKFFRRNFGGQSGTWPLCAPSTAVLSCRFHSTISLCSDFIHPPPRLTASFCNKLQHLLPFLSRITSDPVRRQNCLPFYVIKMFPWTCYFPGGYRLFQSVKKGDSVPQIKVKSSSHSLERGGIPFFGNY